MTKRIYRTRKGNDIDVEAFRTTYAKEVAAGNMRVNAQGDKLGKGGRVVKTVREVTKPYYEDNPKAVKRVSIKKASAESVDAEIEQQLIENLPASKKKTKETKKARKKAPDEIIMHDKNKNKSALDDDKD